jgi:hypothetical protein
MGGKPGGSAIGRPPGSGWDMTGYQAAVTRATAAVFVAGRRAGSAVLVDGRHLITAAHVLLAFDGRSGAKAPVDEVEV